MTMLTRAAHIRQHKDEAAKKIGAAYEEHKGRGIYVGRLLIAQKASMPSGAWTAWLRDNRATLGFDERAAQRMMRWARCPNLEPEQVWQSGEHGDTSRATDDSAQSLPAGVTMDVALTMALSPKALSAFKGAKQPQEGEPEEAPAEPKTHCATVMREPSTVTLVNPCHVKARPQEPEPEDDDAGQEQPEPEAPQEAEPKNKGQKTKGVTASVRVALVMNEIIQSRRIAEKLHGQSWRDDVDADTAARLSVAAAGAAREWQTLADHFDMLAKSKADTAKANGADRDQHADQRQAK